MSEGGESGTGPNQAPGGGPITIRTCCILEVSATGVVSSKGQDPGADLVHLEGCDVNIDGLVQSTGPGHVVPHQGATLLNHCDIPSAQRRRRRPATATDTGCIEVWAEELTISNTGEVNADVNSTGSGGPTGTSYIDLFARQGDQGHGQDGGDRRSRCTPTRTVVRDTSPNTITVLSHTSTITATGTCVLGVDTANGSWGGTVDLEASLKVDLSGATVQAAGHNGRLAEPAVWWWFGCVWCGWSHHREVVDQRGRLDERCGQREPRLPAVAGRGHRRPPAHAPRS